MLAYNLLVVVFGAFVRATGSGAGCGAHWPLCNGVVIPRPERIETYIEFTHRLMSGLVLILAVVLVVWAWRVYAKGSKIRFMAGMTLFFTITEALVGAGLVLFQLVAQNDSLARVYSVMVHLVNTFLLVGTLAVVAWWSSVGEPETLRVRGWLGGLLIAGGVAILALGASGAVTALGDTLFPSGSLAEGMAQDFSPTANFLTRIRIYHPMIAVAVGVFLFAVTLWARRRGAENNRVQTLTAALFALYGMQIFAGILNVALLAPVWMQLVHLLLADLVWVAFVLLGAVTLGSADLAPRRSDHPVHRAVGQST